MSTPGPTRRLVLATGAGGAMAALAMVAGCSRASSAPLEPSDAISRRRGTGPADPDGAVRRTVAIGTMVLLARYYATAARHPALGAELARPVADHRAHLFALIGVGSGSGRASRPGSSNGRSAESGIRVPARPRAAIAALAGAESEAAGYRSELVGTASSASFAALLAAIAASQFTHGALLRAGDRELSVEPGPAGRPPDGLLDSFAVDALQDALGAEHAALFGYGSLGAWLTGGALVRAHQAYDAHRRRRDRLEQFIRRAGAQPQPAAAAYQLPFTVTSGQRARRLAAGIEDGVADAYGWLVTTAGRGSSLRIDAAGWLTEAALRAASWRRASRALPGLPDGR
jgi:hypothetical protein